MKKLIIPILSILFLCSLISAATLNVNDNTAVGIVRDDFYGSNTGGKYLNTTEYQNVWLDSGMKLDRIDAFINLLYSNSSDGTVNYTQIQKNLTSVIDGLKWKHQYGIKTVVILDYMPTWLADNSSGYCLDLRFCPTRNNTFWANLTVDYIKRVTEDNSTLRSDLIIEVWNEPDLSFWMGGLSIDNISKALNYSILYNETYNQLKANYPDLIVGGAAIGQSWRTNMVKTFLSNFSNKMDFYSFHTYMGANVNYGTNFYDYIKNFTNEAYSFCNTYNANCNRIILSEWNDANDTIKNMTINQNEYGMQLALGYSYGLNNYPSNLSYILYEFSRDSSYTGGDLWEMYINNTRTNPIGNYTAAFNVTKNFATYCPPGSIVYQTTSDDSAIRSVACADDPNFNLIIINRENNDNAVTIDFTGLDTSRMRAVDKQGNYYPIPANSVLDLGTLSAFEILELSGENCPAGLVLANDRVTCVNQIDNSCEDTINNFTGIIVIIGLLLAIVLIVAVVGLLASAFGVIPDVDVGSIDLKTVLISVAIVSVVAILIIFIIYMFESGLCPAFGG